MLTRRALVIAGGGAKGAYAFGCLEAFAEKGIDFDCVAGTSAGALNAALWSTGALDEGRKLWSELSFATTLPCRFPRPFSWRPLALSLGFVILVLNLIWAVTHGRPVPCKRWILGLLALVTACAVELFIQFIRPGAGIGFRLFLLELCLLPSVSAALGMGWATRFYFFGLPLISITLPMIYLFDRIITHSWVTTILMIPIFAIGFLIVWLTNEGLEAFIRSGVILDSSPLLATIEAIFAAHPFICPSYVTLAMTQELWDPDECPHVMDDTTPGHRLTIPQTYWIPSYVPLQKLAIHDAARACTASAALPFGLVAAVNIDGRSYVDGGVVDNVPIFPFVNTQSVDKLFVVLLDHFDSDADAIAKAGLTPEEWSRKKRLDALRYVPLPPDSLPYEKLIHHSPPVVVPLEAPAHFPEITLFYPREPLGGFVGGTLNFRSTYARNLIKAGYKDALNRLSGM